MWSRKTQKQRDDLKEADRELSATLGDFYQQKHDELNTGER
jgi:tRNA U34 5-methylaminomethyl-2-thiouridine-forming methyltransferase MnmC